MGGDRSLSNRLRGSLLKRVSATRSAASVRSSARSSENAAAPSDFSGLAGYDELRLYQKVGKKLGVGNPYFRLHDGLAAARTEIDGRAVLNFASYDYLGLNGHPEITAAVHEAVDRYGVSSSGSRCVSGERLPHRELERALADHYRVADSMVFVSGYATNLSVIGQLVGAKDLLVSDALVHNSAVMGGVLSGANRRSFPHNDLDSLERLLATERDRAMHALIVVEGLYSMDGDFPDLPRLIEIKRRHNAWLMVDEAHAFGVLGKTGGGLAEHFGIDPGEVDIWMGTLSKTLAACGGYIAGSAELVDYLKNYAGAFTYSVAMPPLVAVAAAKALEIFHREPERVERLQRNAAFFVSEAKSRGLDTGHASDAVIPVFVGDSLPSVMMSQRLLARGLNVMPVFYPAVPAQEARLRFFVSAQHSESDIVAALDLTAEELKTVKSLAKKISLNPMELLTGRLG